MEAEQISRKMVLFFSLDLFYKGIVAAYRIYPEAKFINDAETVLCLKNELYNWERTLKSHLLLDCNRHCSVLTSLPFFTVPTYNSANSRIVLIPVSSMHFPMTHFRVLHTAIIPIFQSHNSQIWIQCHLWQVLTWAKGQDTPWEARVFWSPCLLQVKDRKADLLTSSRTSSKTKFGLHFTGGHNRDGTTNLFANLSRKEREQHG